VAEVTDHSRPDEPVWLADDPRLAFVMTLGRALHRYGVPAHRLEEALEQVSSRAGLQGQFFSTPTSIMAGFGSPGNQRACLVREQPGDVDLEKLVELDALTDRLTRTDLAFNDALREVEAILAAPPRYRPPMIVIGGALAAAGAARFFEGGWREIVVACGVGLVSSLLVWGLTRRPSTARIHEAAAALVATALATWAADVLSPLSSYVVTLAALILLIPGLTLTLAMNELATNHLVSGTARLTGAAMTFLKIGLGVALGTRLGEVLRHATPHAAAAPLALPPWTILPALVVSPLAIGVLFKARPRELGWIVATSWTAYAGARVGVAVIGPGLGAFLGALAVGIAANSLARWLRRPSVVFLVPGIMLLVPGSVGYRSLAALLHSDVVSGVDAGFSAVLVGVTLAAGLLLANVLVPPRRAL
jgi:uncharacterized membrane protein YjjP (DUF1212 family)